MEAGCICHRKDEDDTTKTAMTTGSGFSWSWYAVVLVSTLILSRFAPTVNAFVQTRHPKRCTAQYLSVPQPPWRFRANHLLYQLRWIRADKAQRYCPRNNNCTLVSFGGYTLGGIFCIDYEYSPVGPYREVAILSGLLIHKAMPFTGGAWASHILVDSPQAATYGKAYWGLPATLVSGIGGMEPLNEKLLVPTNTPATTSIRFVSHPNDDDVRVDISNWTAKKSTSRKLSWFNLALASLSGCLSKGTTRTTPLLEYPLRIFHPSAIRRVPPVTFDFCYKDKNNTIVQQIEDLLRDSHEFVSIAIDHVELEAGVSRVLVASNDVAQDSAVKDERTTK